MEKSALPVSLIYPSSGLLHANVFTLMQNYWKKNQREINSKEIFEIQWDSFEDLLTLSTHGPPKCGISQLDCTKMGSVLESGLKSGLAYIEKEAGNILLTLLSWFTTMIPRSMVAFKASLYKEVKSPLKSELRQVSRRSSFFDDATRRKYQFLKKKNCEFTSEFSEKWIFQKVNFHVNFWKNTFSNWWPKMMILPQCGQKRALNYCYRAFLTKVTLAHMKLTNTEKLKI